MEGFGQKSYDNLIASIEKASHTTLPRLLYSLGISNVGIANAKMICKEFRYDLGKIIHATPEEISSIEGIGPVIAGTFTEYFADEDNMKRLEHLLSHLTFEEVKTESTPEPGGKTVCYHRKRGAFCKQIAVKRIYRGKRRKGLREV